MKPRKPVLLESAHHVPLDMIEGFLVASKGLIAAASQARGYLTSYVSPPSPGGTGWNIAVQFDSVQSARRWRKSSSHRQWISLAGKFAPQQALFSTRIPRNLFAPAHTVLKLGVPRWKMAAVNLAATFPVVLGTNVMIVQQVPDLTVIAQTAALCVIVSVSMSWIALPALARLALTFLRARSIAAARSRPLGSNELAGITQMKSGWATSIPGDLFRLPTIPDNYRPKPTPGRHSPTVRSARDRLDMRSRTERINFRGTLDIYEDESDPPG
ncbi:antibiotic biosynthesis monooxygenase (ABM) superfamily enzyme [Kibdelosporangium banguiense]|uniref:Antibiotic biosynthesis monooxygenase (ABM) superfamily enzyme n=1 Tax=Kibdelosporangium banguiense TaxID=1365924 RepID=A0ABS4TIB1_9PSEU|nr:hypothetical protein [Kibdelosporangium banguiense]MBP2324166.1 antibiotic biosynthesis monooxygenase (ABM) superfamily enzyme [Kibdelosporangium banguiense]